MRSKTKGGILIYILGMITLVSIIVTEFLIEAATAVRYHTQIAGREDLELIANSALESSVAVLGELKLVDEGLFAPSQGWGDPMKYMNFPLPGGYTANVSVTDETGKLSIYETDLVSFGNLLVEMGLSFEIVSNLKSEVQKYLSQLNKEAGGNNRNRANRESNDSNRTSSGTASPNQATTGNATAAGQNAAAQGTGEGGTESGNERRRNNNSSEEKKTRILFNLEQLKEIPIFEKTFFDAKGNPNELFKILKQNVSVLNTGKVNINTAPEMVKKVILGNLNTTVPGKKYLTSMKDLKGVLAENQQQALEKKIGFKATVFNIEIEVNRGPVKYHLGTIVEDKKPETNGGRNRNASGGNASAGTGEGGTTGQGSATSQRSTGGASAGRGRDARASRPTSTLQEASRGGKTDSKGDFSFLALTEDDSFVN